LLFVIPPLLAGVSADQPKSAARKELENIRDQVRRAHAAGDAVAYLAQSRKMREFLNGSPNSVLQVMSAEAFAGDSASALRSYKQYIQMGQSNPSAFEAKQFDTLRNTAEFLNLKSEMVKNDAAVLLGTEVLRMPDADLVPEDIDYDPAQGQFYVSCVKKQQILTFDPNGHFRVFARAPDSWPMMALKVDSRRRTLWATEVALHGFKSIAEADWGTSVVLIYDLDSGKLLHRIPGPPQTTLGDMTLTPDGDAIVSDNNEGAMYRVHRKKFDIERLDSGDFISPQTAVMSSNETQLFVPDYVRGIGILDLNTKRVTWLNSEGVHALDGIDGLYLHGTTLVATQNGTSPERVVRFELDKSLTHVESEAVIERATPNLGDPTHGVIVNGSFYYIANSGWDVLEDDGTPKPGSKPTSALIMRAELAAKPK
jgi:sugar lactone lactonase YvrE